MVKFEVREWEAYFIEVEGEGDSYGYRVLRFSWLSYVVEGDGDRVDCGEEGGYSCYYVMRREFLF